MDGFVIKFQQANNPFHRSWKMRWPQMLTTPDSSIARLLRYASLFLRSFGVAGLLLCLSV